MQFGITRSWSRRMATAALAVAAVAAMGACTSGDPASSSASAATGQHVAAIDFSTALKEPGTIVLDVRTPAEFATGHLPRAQNIDFESSDFAARIADLDKSVTYAVYCHSGNRSGTALEQMRTNDFTHVYDLAGGIVAWQTMGGPIVMGG